MHTYIRMPVNQGVDISDLADICIHKYMYIYVCVSVCKSTYTYMHNIYIHA